MSDYKVSNNVMYEPTLTAPTAFTATPATYVGGDVTLKWSGTKAGIYLISRYEIQYATSANNTTWSAWLTLTSIPSSLTFGEFKTTKLNATMNGYTRFQIRAADNGGNVTDYKISGSVKTTAKPAPLAPTINAPAANASTLNEKPRILATVASTTNTVVATGYTASSRTLATGRKVILRSTASLTGSKSISVTATDSYGGASPAATRNFKVVKMAHSEATHGIPGEPMLAVQIINLRTWINNIRAYYAMPAKTWAVNVLGGSTLIAGWKDNVTEMRKAIEEIVALVNGWDTASKVHDIALPAWLPLDEHNPAGAVITQLWDVLESL